MMLEATDTEFAPWYIVSSDDKKRARLNVLSPFSKPDTLRGAEARENQAAVARQ